MEQNAVLVSLKKMNEWTEHIRFHKKRMLANFELSMGQSYDIFKSATP